MSATDRAIIGDLQENGRRTFVTIARDLGLSEKTDRMRVHHLLQENIIQIAALTNPVALGYRAAALVGLRTDPGVPTSEIAVALREIPDLDYVIVTAGRYNLLVGIISHGTPSMQAVIEREVGRIRGIGSVEVFPYFSIYYQNARFFGVDGGSSFGWAVKEEELDPIDRRIVLELSNDGRAPLKEIADRLDVSESQVRTRIGNMVSVGKMKIMAIVNPMNLPEHAIAYVAVQAKQNFSLHSVAEQLSQMPQVVLHHDMRGPLRPVRRGGLFVEQRAPASHRPGHTCLTRRGKGGDVHLYRPALQTAHANAWVIAGRASEESVWRLPG
ncbi:MAG: hypothetical protein QOK29_4660 [Rhodospirillaceae bacterium]|nr:hypothetical protein [Rhodospirillaceae bacterium]